MDGCQASPERRGATGVSMAARVACTDTSGQRRRVHGVDASPGPPVERRDTGPTRRAEGFRTPAATALADRYAASARYDVQSLRASRSSFRSELPNAARVVLDVGAGTGVPTRAPRETGSTLFAGCSSWPGSRRRQGPWPHDGCAPLVPQNNAWAPVHPSASLADAAYFPRSFHAARLSRMDRHAFDRWPARCRPAPADGQAAGFLGGQVITGTCGRC